MMNKKQAGFMVLELILILVVIGAIGFVGFKLFFDGGKQGGGEVGQKAVVSGRPVWEYNQEKLEWFVKSGAAPKCKEPLVLDMSPVDMSLVTAVGLPGAYRGYNYKPHGVFRLTDSTKGNVEVKLPMDATLKGVTRYYESTPGYPDELQYMLDFESDCGIALKFDHLYTLTPELQQIAEKTPPPKKNDTRRDPGEESISIPYKAGTVVATTVGFPAAKNYGFDFGMYDYRSRNEISKNAQWAEIHKSFSATTFHGVCWIPLLPGGDAAKAEAIAKDRRNYNSNRPFNLTSDYCSFAPNNTLKFNNGQPTDG